jgi:K+-transporting ATPase ATPase C chain
MRRDILKEFYRALAALVLLTILTGMVYPLVVTVLAQTAFPRQAGGSLILRDGRAVGSELIGQPFSSPKYFWGRPSATAVTPDNATSSSGSNLGPTNPDLEKAVAARIKTLQDADPGFRTPVPADLVTSSASGLDPDISPEAAECQIPRVARVRGLAVEDVHRLVQEHVEARTWGVLGEPRVNVLQLNLALDALSRKAR